MRKGDCPEKAVPLFIFVRYRRLFPAPAKAAILSATLSPKVYFLFLSFIDALECFISSISSSTSFSSPLSIIHSISFLSSSFIISLPNFCADFRPLPPKIRESRESSFPFHQLLKLTHYKSPPKSCRLCPSSWYGRIRLSARQRARRCARRSSRAVPGAGLPAGAGSGSRRSRRAPS